MHLLLSSYALVPFAVMLALLILGGETPFVRPNDVGGWRVWRRLDIRSRRSLALAFLALGLASTGAYYALLSAILISALAVMRSLAVRRSAPAMAGLVFSAILGIGLVANLMPSIVFWANNGINTEVGKRTPIEPELYGLKLTSMIFPTDDHRVPALASLVAEYNDDTPVPSERGMALGAIGAFGLFASVGLLLVRSVRDRGGSMTLLERCGAVSLAAYLLGTIAGLSVPLALVGLRELRSWNRIVVYIAFASLVAVAAIAEPIARRVRPRAALYTLLAVLVFGGILDQTPKTFPDKIDAAGVAAWSADQAFYREVAANVGDGPVLQLPYVAFPESAPVGGVGPYDHALAFVHAPNTRWSFGATIGREPIVAAEVSAAAPVDLADAARAAGYVAIVIDRRGPQDTAAILAALEAEGTLVRHSEDRLVAILLTP
jgi:phosphoglycerol transferase